MKIAEMEAAYDAARRAEERVRAKRNEAMKAAAEAAGATFDADMKAAADARVAAYVALLDAREAAALKGKGAPVPLGAALCRWGYEYTGSRYYQRAVGPKKVLEEGVFEAFTRTSARPENEGYGAAEPGDFVIRPLKKDGTPGKRYIRVRPAQPLPSGWELKE